MEHKVMEHKVMEPKLESKELTQTTGCDNSVDTILSITKTSKTTKIEIANSIIDKAARFLKIDGEE